MTTKMTVGETLKEIEYLTQKQAVLDEIVEYLAQFVATDSFTPSKGIASPLAADVIPQDIIEEVKSDLFVKRVEYEAKIQELKGRSISGSSPKSSDSRKAPPKRRKRRKPGVKKESESKKG